MKRTLISILIGMVVVVGLNMGQARCQETPPAISVSVALLGPEGTAASSFTLNQPIGVVISLANVGTEDVVTTKGFSAKPFHLELHFTYLRPDGKKEIITTLFPVNKKEPGPPRIKSIGGQMVQVEFVEVLVAGWVLTMDPFNALGFYELNRTGRYSVKAIIPARTFPLSEVRSISSNPYVPLGSASWENDLESNPVSFTITGDADQDGYCYPEPCEGMQLVDCNDKNNNVHPLTEEILNNGIDDDCDPMTVDKADVPTGTVEVRVEMHAVGLGSRPTSGKQPLPGILVNLYDKSAGSCASGFDASWQFYSAIWQQCATPYSRITGADGKMAIQVAPGNYVMIGEFDPDDYAVPLPVDDTPGNEFYAGGNVNNVNSGETMTKWIKIIVKSDGKNVPAKYTQLTGSQLLIIESEYVEWDGTQELYPFLFESVGDWAVKTSVSPPEGFVADYKSLSEEVNTELEAVQFTITDIGSEWKDTEVSYEVTHKGKKVKIKSKIGVKLSKELAKKKGVDEYGNKAK